MANANLELLVGRPAGAPVVQAYLDGDDTVAPFFRRSYRDPTAYASKAEEIDRRFDRRARERAAEALIVPPDADGGRIERFVEQGGYMVTTGQQPALFGGPLYSILKALTAVRLAERLEAELGRPVLPLFWVASDDHDWREANHADVIDVENELRRLEVDPPDPSASPPLHRVPLGPDVRELTEDFLRCLPETDFTAPYFTLLREAFRPGVTLPEGFLTTLQTLLGRFGLFFTDAAQPALKRHSRGLLRAELDRSAPLEAVLFGTSHELQAAGFDLQVAILEGAVNLFLEGPAGRERLYRDGDGFRLRASGERVTAQQIDARLDEDPTVLSPNVLLRPVVESAVFPTLSYVGGPGEMAYFAQLGDYFAAHDIEMPVVFPRWSVMPVERKVRKVLDKFDVDVGTLERPFHEIAGAFAREEVPDPVRAALGKLRGAVGQAVGELTAATRPIDPTLKGSVQHLRSQAFAAIDDLEKKVVTAVKRETDIALAQLEKAQVNLYPSGVAAERVLSPFYYLARYGSDFLDALYERFEVNLDRASHVDDV